LYFHLCRFSLRRLTSTSTLFPYTTLFRSLRRLRNRSLLASAFQFLIFEAIPPLIVVLFPKPLEPVSHSGPPSPSYASSATSSARSEEHTSELQSPDHLVCRLLLEKKKNTK